jgi:hypothetical protein
MDVPVLLGDGIDQVERPDHVVHLGVDSVLAVDHRIRRRPLLGEVHDGVRFERRQRLAHEGRVGEIAHVDADVVARHLFPPTDPLLEAGDGDQRVDTHLEVIAPAGEVVDDAYPVALAGQVESGRPTQVAISSEYQDVHAVSPSFPVLHASPLTDVGRRMQTPQL